MYIGSGKAVKSESNPGAPIEEREGRSSILVIGSLMTQWHPQRLNCQSGDSIRRVHVEQNDWVSVLMLSSEVGRKHSLGSEVKWTWRCCPCKLPASCSPPSRVSSFLEKRCPCVTQLWLLSLPMAMWASWMGGVQNRAGTQYSELSLIFFPCHLEIHQ